MEAKIISAPLFIFFKFLIVKKPLKVLILFLLANLAKFFAGSIPKTFLKPKFRNGVRAQKPLNPVRGVGSGLGIAQTSLPAQNTLNKLSVEDLSLIHISEPTRLRRMWDAGFCVKKK